MRGPGVIIVAACALFVAPARGSVEDFFGGGARTMRAYRDDGNGRERPRRLELDGMSLAVAAGGTSDAPGDVGNWYAATLGDARHGCGVRFGDDDRGGVAAIDYGETLDGNGVAARMGRLAASGDLGALGQLQAVTYERRGDGGTRYLSLWGGLALDKLLPPDGGDVAGGDLDGVPRPDGGARVLVAGERGASGRVVAYRVADASAVAVRGAFVDELHARGWRSDEGFARFASAHGRSGERLWRHGREIFVDVGRQGDDVSVVVIEMEKRG
ncbi:MAG TPA: hypothetical protein VGL86_05165 [Polyangia bacterium]|jgi:hypothetical protein